MAPLSFTKGKVALLEPILQQASGRTGEMQGQCPILGGYRGEAEINLEENERDVGA